jgi:hypothetical protein
MSSGTRVTNGRTLDGICKNCRWEGEVEEVVDPVIYAAGWECPACLYFNDTSDDAFEEDPDDARDRWADDISA